MYEFIHTQFNAFFHIEFYYGVIYGVMLGVIAAVIIIDAVTKNNKKEENNVPDVPSDPTGIQEHTGTEEEER